MGGRDFGRRFGEDVVGSSGTLQRNHMQQGNAPASLDAPHAHGGEALQVRVHEPLIQEGSSTVVYLPGIHGDWTLGRSFRLALGPRVRFVEMTYPRSLDWTLADYGAAIEPALLAKGVSGGWLIGESFGSQVLWELVRRGGIKWDALVLAGGFVRYPTPPLLSIARSLADSLPISVFQACLPGYVAYSRLRYFGQPVALASAKEFVERRTPLDFQAMWHRLSLIAENDPREVAARTPIPVHHLYGVVDPIVPWGPVGRWLRKNCRFFRASHGILGCDHTVLLTGAEASAEQLRRWMAR